MQLGKYILYVVRIRSEERGQGSHNWRGYDTDRGTQVRSIGLVQPRPRDGTGNHVT